MKKLITINILILAAFLIMSGCASENQPSEENVPTMSVGVDRDGKMTYNGNEQLLYEVQEGQKAVVNFKIDAEQGSISFDIHEIENENVHQYRGTITESCEFDVVIDEPNWYRIDITASDFHGTYSIDWKTESAE